MDLLFVLSPENLRDSSKTEQDIQIFLDKCDKFVNVVELSDGGIFWPLRQVHFMPVKQ
jgi:hypothetical protein